VPSGIVAVAGVITIETSAGAVTMSVADVPSEPTLAWIVAVP